jgi:hypothetical protein
MNFYHHTTWQIDPKTLPSEHSTSCWVESHYWVNKPKETEEQAPPLETIQRVVTAVSGEPADRRAALIRAHFGQNAEPAFVDLLSDVASGQLTAEEARAKLRSLKVQAEVSKEAVFEQVRAAEFAGRPSRKRCMFLFSPQDPLAYAARMHFSLASRSVLDIEPLDGAAVHRADAGLLTCTGRPPEVQREFARRYWKGETTESPLEEILLEGPFRIVRVVRSAGL